MIWALCIVVWLLAVSAIRLRKRLNTAHARLDSALKVMYEIAYERAPMGCDSAEYLSDKAKNWFEVH